MSTQVKERTPRIKTRPPHLLSRRFHFSVVEITAASIVVLFFVGVLYYYFSSLKPEQDKITQLQAQYGSLTKALEEMKASGDRPVPVNTVKAALDSLDAFKGDYLKPRSNGQRALIDEINALVKSNSTQLTSGLEMTLENTGVDSQKKGSKSKKAEAPLNVFPKLNVSFTVAGQYNSLRTFINALERSKQFLVIRSLSFTTIEEGKNEGGRKAGPSGLSLSVTLSAYFQP